VGDDLFAAVADQRSAVDWRTEPDRGWSEYALPAEWRANCHEIPRRLDLRFGGIDLLVDEKGEHWFIELNPNGEWGWLERQARLPVAAAIFRDLSGGS
jgi:glutathione synthase/RimK-type ligase-like ATP-grasp enzyme